jgi:opacity protein-like surface antigen
MIPRSNPRIVLPQGDYAMKKLFLVAVLATFAAGSAFAEDSCDTKAMGKDGKPLAGAAKTSFMKKCMADDCATKAVGSDG